MVGSKQKGFTLVELVTVIIVLGVLAAGVSSFLKFGSQIFVEANTRDQLISSARFAVERLNREIRTAVPNSIRTNNSADASIKCLEFMPFVASASYLDIPVAPEPSSNQITVVAFDDSDFGTNLSAVVYATSPNDIYAVTSDHIVGLANTAINKVSNVWGISLSSSTRFAEDSPTSRVYFVSQATSFCIDASGSMRRFHGYATDAAGIPTPYANGVLMAENILFKDENNLDVDFFTVSQATLQRNGQVIISLPFGSNGELISFNNEVQVPNVP
jgi:MSHA biogenesis protein MshO